MDPRADRNTARNIQSRIVPLRKNRREPDTETLAKFADLYGVTIDYLVGRTNNPNSVLHEDVKEFVDQLELSDDELLNKFTLTVDGRQLTRDEARRFIAFIRAERMMN
ncbi:hypothetical protein PACILC2_19420 [Paenibacillus cisolokensis]|uniref:HTH cro/C1-type domain-containing protein n=1 Tax=Paenibacillus cisolokensis TaxID=1658519 RepID=A0ABQ4N5D9_9BACL|nr:transcriptional regulator [Paenibacillus cisolokensis]GIQ63374.1 hypothetical protein PACILC2_19420 [Paenibacillus cisolokensis]